MDLNPKIVLPHSKFEDEFGTNVLFEFDEKTSLSNIIYDTDIFDNDNISNGTYWYYMYRYTSYMDLTNADVTITNTWICSTYGTNHKYELPGLSKLIKNNGYYAAPEALLKNLNTDLGKTASGKISMNKLLTAKLIDKEYTKNNSTYPSFRTFQKNAMKILEHDFSRQPVYEHTGVQIPVKMSTKVLFDPDIIYPINKIINASLPDVFDRMYLKMNCLKYL